MLLKDSLHMFWLYGCSESVWEEVGSGWHWMLELALIFQMLDPLVQHSDPLLGTLDIPLDLGKIELIPPFYVSSPETHY